MKNILYILVFIISTIGCQNSSDAKKNSDSLKGSVDDGNCGKFVNRVWMDFGCNNFVKVEKENGVFIVYYCDNARGNIDKFIATCNGNALKGDRNGQTMTMAVLESGNLLVNQTEIKSEVSVLEEWEKKKTKQDEEKLYNDFEHDNFAMFLTFYDFFKNNKNGGDVTDAFRKHQKSMCEKYNTSGGDIGIGKDKDINQKYRNDVIAEIRANE
jgi:hypothetical protein